MGLKHAKNLFNDVFHCLPNVIEPSKNAEKSSPNWSHTGRALAEKSCDMFDFHGNTSSNRTGAWSHHAFVKLFPLKQQSNEFSKPPCTSPINASGAKNVNNVIRFVHQCKSTLYLHLIPLICCSSLDHGTIYWLLNFHTEKHPNHSGPPAHENT